MKKITVIILSMIMVLATSVYAFAVPASAATDDYVYWDGNEDSTKSDGFVKVNSTSYEIHTPSGFFYFLRTVSDGNTYKGCTISLKNNLFLDTDIWHCYSSFSC